MRVEIWGARGCLPTQEPNTFRHVENPLYNGLFDANLREQAGDADVLISTPNTRS